MKNDQELAASFSKLRRSKRLHPLCEERLSQILRNLYPGKVAVKEPGEIPGGRSDLGFYFENGFYVIFELFATKNQVPQDLRHLEGSDAHLRIAIIVDEFLDDGVILNEYIRKKPNQPFPWIFLSQVLVHEKEVSLGEYLKKLIDVALIQFNDSAKHHFEPADLRLFLFEDSGIHHSEITFTRKGILDRQRFLFGVALLNLNKSSPPAQGLNIKVDVYWDGSNLKHPPKIATDVYRRTTKGWETRRSKIMQKGDLSLQATLVYDGDQSCAFGIGLEWTRFVAEFQDEAKGKLLMYYRVSSINPQSVSQGELTINVDLKK